MCSDLKKFLAAALSLAAAFSCTVLEDRGECPCFLSLDLSDENNEMCEGITLNLSAEGYSKKICVEREDFAEPLVVTVPRGAVSLNAFDSALDSCSGSLGLEIPLGQQCPEAYMFSLSCDTTPDETSCRVRLRKNYCGVSMSFTGEDSWRLAVEVEGGVCGYNALGEPKDGDFDFKPDFPAGGNCFFRLPRQSGQALYLHLYSPYTLEQRSLNLGAYIIKSGYDWTKEDLDDIMVKVDYTNLELKISVNEWERVVEDDIVI